MTLATNENILQDTFENMVKAFIAMRDLSNKSRELSLAVTNLEQAMMWLNKERANQGFLEKNSTHVI